MVFVIHWHESAMDLHVFPIPIPPPTSLSTWSLWVFPLHQAQALVSCVWQPGLVICFTIDKIYMFRCCSLKTSHPRLLPQSPKVCSILLTTYILKTIHKRNNMYQIKSYLLSVNTLAKFFSQSIMKFIPFSHFSKIEMDFLAIFPFLYCFILFSDHIHPTNSLWTGHFQLNFIFCVVSPWHFSFVHVAFQGNFRMKLVTVILTSF